MWTARIPSWSSSFTTSTTTLISKVRYPAKYQRTDVVGRVGLPALRRLHQLPCHPVLPAGRSRRPGGSHQRRLVVGGSTVIPHMRDLSNQSHVWRRCVSHNRYIAISYVSLGHPR